MNKHRQYALALEPLHKGHQLSGRQVSASKSTLSLLNQRKKIRDGIFSAQMGLKGMFMPREILHATARKIALGKNITPQLPMCYEYVENKILHLDRKR